MRESVVPIPASHQVSLGRPSTFSSKWPSFACSDGTIQMRSSTSTSYSRTRPSAGASQHIVMLCDPTSFVLGLSVSEVRCTTGRADVRAMVSVMPYVGLPFSSRLYTSASNHTHHASIGSHSVSGWALSS